MELRHLRYFVAIAEERSITRAAERLWIAQPGLSTQIRRLEDELGIKLFERHARGVDLTAAGELFLGRARAALAAADVAWSTGRGLEAGIVGSVRLGIATEAPAQVVPSLLAAFDGDRPEVDVTVVQSYSGALLRDLRDGRLDAVIAPSIFGSAELRRVWLGSEPWAVLVGPGHRLAQAGPIDARELHGVPVVVTGHRDGAGHDRAVAELLEGLGVSPVLRRGGPGPALYSAVAAGLAVAVTTRSAAADAETVVRPLEPTRRMRFALLSRDEAPAPALRELIRTAEAHDAPARPAARPVLAAVA
jgi:DNA-binding transcriptional LysR family regulator